MENSIDSASLARDMQLHTRREKKFDEFEAGLPNPKMYSPIMLSSPSPSPSPSTFKMGGIVKRIGDLNPFGKGVTKNDTIWLLDNTAFRLPNTNSWQAEYVSAVFEKDAHCTIADVVSGIAATVGLADDSKEKATIEERILPFLWDIRMVRIVRVSNQGKEIRMTPTNINGISAQVLDVPAAAGGSWVDSVVKAPRGADGILSARTYYASQTGWGIISDIDDTIKVTMTNEPVGIIQNTFVNEATPVTGMPELYSYIKALLPDDSPWFYLSASPYNLYPFLKEFRDKYYPSGTMILRDFSWRSVAGLLSALTMGTESYKADRMRKVNSWLPQRKMIVIGDSTQSDPEAYGEIYRTCPGWIKLILIRKVEDFEGVAMAEKNQPERFEKAFKDVPADSWHVFTDPKECESLVVDTMARYGDD